MQVNNIVDPKSGQDWYTAAGQLEAYRVARTPVANIPKIPWFENMYPAGSIDNLLFGAGLSNTQAAYGFMAVSSVTPGCNGAPLFGCYDSGDDWTFLQDVLDANIKKLFYQSQYGALSAYGTIASSDYHGATVSIRQRFKGLTWDFNYTFSKSIDDASGLQTSGVLWIGIYHQRPAPARQSRRVGFRHQAHRQLELHLGTSLWSWTDVLFKFEQSRQRHHRWMAVNLYLPLQQRPAGQLAGGPWRLADELEREKLGDRDKARANIPDPRRRHYFAESVL